jgi:HSP20 family protein
MSQITSQCAAPAAATRVEFLCPPVNLHHDLEGYTLEVEMPGVGREGVDVTFEEGKLTLVGHRKASGGEGKSLYSETTGRDYRRVFDLDPAIDAEKITASIEQGLLTLRLPKAESSKPRKISVA